MALPTVTTPTAKIQLPGNMTIGTFADTFQFIISQNYGYDLMQVIANRVHDIDREIMGLEQTRENLRFFHQVLSYYYAEKTKVATAENGNKRK